MTTELPRDLVKRVIDRLMEHYDCGPPGEGWQSETLLSDIAAMEAALAAPTAKGGTEDALRKALNDAAFSIDGIGGAATPTPKLLRILADHLDGIRRIENVPGHARSLRGRADFLDEAALAARAVLAAPTAKGGTECQCEHPFIKCDNTGCRCSYCGLLERLPPPTAKGGTEDTARIRDVIREVIAQAEREDLKDCILKGPIADWRLVASALAAFPSPPAGAAGGGSGDQLQADLAELLAILGLGDHARPQSPHEVFQEALTVLRASEAGRYRDEKAAFERGYSGGLGFALNVCDERGATVEHIKARIIANKESAR